MAFHLQRQLLLLGILLLLQLVANSEAKPQDPTKVRLAAVETVSEAGVEVNTNSDEGDSSSEETVEDSAEATTSSRRRRSAELVDPTSRSGIPGLPDPATIIKVAELFQSVSQQIVPILLETILPGGEATGERIGRDLMFLNNIKRSMEIYSNELND